MSEGLDAVAGAMTQAASRNERLIDKNSQEYAETLAKEKTYLEAVLTTFGEKSEPKNTDSVFEPSVIVEDSTNLGDLKPNLENALSSGVEYWKSYIKAAKFSPLGEAQLAMYERGLGFLRGERKDTRSFIESVNQMSAITSSFANSQYEERLNNLYASENAKSWIGLGKLVYGKIGVLWNVGGAQMHRYNESFQNHINRVKEASLRSVPQQ